MADCSIYLSLEWCLAGTELNKIMNEAFYLVIYFEARIF
jgi:hypothetical protein